MAVRIVIVLLVLASFAPASASGGTTCAGTAPADATCERSFTLTTGELAVGVRLGHGLGIGFDGVLQAVFQGDDTAETITCASTVLDPFSPCQASPPGDWHKGDRITLRVLVVGYGPWRVDAESF